MNNSFRSNNGGFVVTWLSEGQNSKFDIYGQRYDANGIAQAGEFRVNTTTSSFDHSIVALTNGGFVATWSSRSFNPDAFGIYGQRFDANGVAQGNEFLSVLLQPLLKTLLLSPH